MQTGGGNSAAFVYLGFQANSIGTYTLQNGSLATAAFQFVGLGGTGTFNQIGGTNMIDSSGLGNGYGALEIGAGPGGVGYYTLSGGSVSVLHDPLTIGFDAGSKGTFNLISGSLSSQGDEQVGHLGTGTFNQTGGTNTITSGNLVVGAFAGSVGTYTLSAGSASTSNNVMVGPGGVGVLTVTGTGVLTTNSLQVFRSITTPGTVVNLSGGTINTPALNFNGNPSAFNWTGGTLNLTTDVTWDSAADPTSTSSAFGPSLVLNNTQTLSIAGSEILGGVGPFGLTLNGGCTHTVTGTITISSTGTLTLNGGTLNVGTLLNNGTFNFFTGTLGINQAGATIDTPIVTGSPSTININADNISLGRASSFTGFNHQGILNVGAYNVTLNSAGYARLGVLTSLSGGTITASDGVYLSGGGNLVGNGAVNARITGDSGSVIEAAGSLALGDASSPAGFNYAGELHTKQFSVTLNSSGPATLGSLTTLGSGASPGSLSANNGFVVDFGKAVTGYGSIDSTNTLATLATINGSVQGDSPAHPITLSGYIKGTGTFNNVNFTGTYSPGLSPTVATVGNISLVPSSTLIMEIGGANSGSGYDKIQASGTLALGGTLDVALIGSFTPTAGQTFDLFDWTTLSGKFSLIMLPNLNDGPLGWDTSHLYTTGVLAVTATLAGDINRDGHVDVADVSALMSALADLDKYRSTYGLADPQQFKLVADVNGDGQVTNADVQGLINYLANNAGACPPPAAAALPPSPNRPESRFCAARLRVSPPSFVVVAELKELLHFPSQVGIVATSFWRSCPIDRFSRLRHNREPVECQSQLARGGKTGGRTMPRRFPLDALRMAVARIATATAPPPFPSLHRLFCWRWEESSPCRYDPAERQQCDWLSRLWLLCADWYDTRRFQAQHDSTRRSHRRQIDRPRFRSCQSMRTLGVLDQGRTVIWHIISSLLDCALPKLVARGGAHNVGGRLLYWQLRDTKAEVLRRRAAGETRQCRASRQRTRRRLCARLGRTVSQQTGQ